MMLWRPLLIACTAVFLGAQAVQAAENGHAVVELPLWSVAPFAVLLSAIALLPLAAGDWWHHNHNKAYVTAALALPTVAYLVYLQMAYGLPTAHALGEKALDYVSFIALLGSLYIVSSGILISGSFQGRPVINTAMLASGIVLSNLVGTTGASMLLIHTFLRDNAHRMRRGHLPVFFIFSVGNTGGLLTPLGDPPLFLGFLDGVPFAWTLRLWPHWLLVNGFVLAVFYVWDTLAYRKEIVAPTNNGQTESLGIHGLVNVPLLAGIVAAVLVQSTLTAPWRELVPTSVMVVVAILSLVMTPRSIREVNGFTWEPVGEVAILFAGIFVTMVPALTILAARGGEVGVTQPWQFFWLTGILSGCLDNAPTYMTFAALASGEHTTGWLAAQEPTVLAAISCGAVFMGALTYIGNGPNFLVKAIAERAGYPMPSFFGYLGYSWCVLLPVFLLVTLVFFSPM
jgi:Na+/H+ antiporter NhaD/arsenite permease-like protein